MRLKLLLSVWAAMLALQLSLATAAPAVIGTVEAKGSFRVDHSTVTGNATLFEGAFIETGTAGSSMRLSSGAKVLLGAESTGRFFTDRMILEKGEGQLATGPDFRCEARGLTIQPETGTASARVALAGSTRVRVAALSGSFRVLNAKGELVANLTPGRTVEFEPQSSAAVKNPRGLSKTVPVAAGVAAAAASGGLAAAGRFPGQGYPPPPLSR